LSAVRSDKTDTSDGLKIDLIRQFIIQRVENFPPRTCRKGRHPSTADIFHKNLSVQLLGELSNLTPASSLRSIR